MAQWSDFLDPNEPDGAYLSWSKVEARVGISRTTAWRLQKRGDFPRPYVMSPGRVAYRESEVEAWKASRGHRSESRPVEHVRPRSAAATPGDSPPAAASKSREPVQPRFELEVPPAPPPPNAQAARPASRSRSGRSGDDQITFNF